MSIAHHIIIRPADSKPIFTDLATRRLFTRKVVLVAGDEFDVTAWGAGDNHGHVKMMGRRSAATELGRRLEGSLALILGLEDGFVPVKVKPIWDQAHVYATLRYVIRQGERHGVTCDPFHEGSSLPDALGFRRVAPGLPALLERVAPRFDATQLLPELAMPPADDDAPAWAEAVAAALGLPDLRGGSDLLRLARRTVIALAPGASTTALSVALGCSARRMRRLRGGPAPPRGLVEAATGQACWRQAHRRCQRVAIAPLIQPPMTGLRAT